MGHYDVFSDSTKKYAFHNLNKHLHTFEDDYFYHLYLGKNQNDLKAMFGDVKFVCMGGTSKRMQKFAHYMTGLLGYKIPTGLTLNDITKPTDRYSMYKVGQILFANHGIGCPSLSILLNEIMKLLHYAGCEDITFFRIGTSGGIGVEPGTVIVTEEAVDGLLRPEYRQFVLGKEKIRETQCDKQLIKELLDISKDMKVTEKFNVVSGKTLCAHDFYEGQSRIDGVFCDYTHDEKIEFLKHCNQQGIVNMEMESLCFAGMLNHAKTRFGIVCVALLNRLENDQITASNDLIMEYQERPFEIIGEYIRRRVVKNED